MLTRRNGDGGDNEVSKVTCKFCFIAGAEEVMTGWPEVVGSGMRAEIQKRERLVFADNPFDTVDAATKFAKKCRQFLRMRPTIGKVPLTCFRAPSSMLKNIHSELPRIWGQVTPLE